MHHKLPRLLWIALLIFVANSPLASQQGTVSRPPSRIPVTIVLLDELPQREEFFVVQRRASVRPHDVILLRRNANPVQLSEAIRTVLTARQMSGDVPQHDVTIRRRPHRPEDAKPAEFPWVPRVMADLRASEFRQVAGIGEVKAVQIWLPASR